MLLYFTSQEGEDMEAAEDNLGDSSAQPNSPWALARLFSNIALILILIMNIFNTGEVGAVKVESPTSNLRNTTPPPW